MRIQKVRRTEKERGRNVGRAREHEGGKEYQREPEQALMVACLSPWDSFLERDGLWTTRNVPETYSLLTCEAVRNSSLGISRMMTCKCLLAYVSSAGVVTGTKKAVLWRCTCGYL